MRIFFSHSSRDKALLRELRGYFPPWLSSWIDEDALLAGSALELSLKRAIDEEVDFVVIFIGREALESDWVRREIEWALAREEQLGRVFLLPVLLIDLRERLDEVGLAGRITLEIADFSRDGIKLLAERLTNHLGGWLSEMLKICQATSSLGRNRRAGLDELADAVSTALASVPTAWRSEVDTLLTRPFLQHLTSSQIGEIPLTPSQYYQRILAEMARAGAGWEVLAVSTLTSMLWTSDLDQMRYAERNLAAVQRGARIHRLFLVPEGSEEEFRPLIEAQARCGIDVKFGTNRLFAHVTDLDDFVMFRAPDGTRTLLAHPTVDGSRRIRSGILDASDNRNARLRGAFWDTWELALTLESLERDRDAGVENKASPDPPGLTMKVHKLSAPVVGCEEAARARGIPLANELKTLILRTHDGFIAAHLPGDGVLSLRKVKDRLETAEGYLADPEDLLELGLSPGTVSAVLDPVWSMPHLVSRRLLNLSEVMTNNGTKTGYFAFEPTVLVEANDVIVGDFEK